MEASGDALYGYAKRHRVADVCPGAVVVGLYIVVLYHLMSCCRPYVEPLCRLCYVSKNVSEKKSSRMLCGVRDVVVVLPPKMSLSRLGRIVNAVIVYTRYPASLCP